jgi:hypothetical protein
MPLTAQVFIKLTINEQKAVINSLVEQEAIQVNGVETAV